MKQPDIILSAGTKIISHNLLNNDALAGSNVKRHHLDSRGPTKKGSIKGVVGGCGGDVYWVTHPDGGIAAYGWWEFELDT